MTGIIGLAGAEFRIATRNRWVTIVIAIMVLFSLVLSAVGSAPTGALGSDSLSVTVASLTGLAVYLVPLVALLMSFDAVAGEVERGTLPLMLTYPVSRAGVLLGKFLAHLSILAVAVAAGYGAAAASALAVDPDTRPDPVRKDGLGRRPRCHGRTAGAGAAILVISAFGRHVPRDRLRRIGLCLASWCRCRAGHRRLACPDRSIRPRPAGCRRG